MSAKSIDSRTADQAWRGALGAILIALCAVGNYLAFRHYTRWDWTSSGVFTLSGRTVQVLHQLDQDVDVYVFLSSLERTQHDVRELLGRYRSKTSKIHVRYVDPNTKQDEFRVLAQRFHLSGMQVDENSMIADVAAVLVSGERQWKITSDDLNSIDLDTVSQDPNAQNPQQLVKIEQAFTSGILQVTRGRATTICLTQGHGEWPLDGGGERSLTTFKDEMLRDNLVFRELQTLGLGQVPADCDALFIIGPSNAFTESESVLIERYVAGGGNALLALDPVMEREQFQPTGLESFARSHGVLIDSSVVIELDSAHRLEDELLGHYLITDYGNHPLTQSFARLQARTVVHFSRSVRPSEGTAAKSLLRTSTPSYAETTFAELSGQAPPTKDDHDFAGPVSIAAAVELAKPQGSTLSHGGRLIVVGTSSFLSPQALLTPAFVNFDVASAWTGWLTQRPELVSIAPRRIAARPITMTDDDIFWLFFRLVVFMPAAAMFIGLALWRARRA